MSIKSWPWLGWLVVVAALTFQPFLWHVEHFKTQGLQYYRLLLVILPVLALGLPAYAWVRLRGGWRYEPLLVASGLTAFALAREPRATLVMFAILWSTATAGRFFLRRLRLTSPDALEDVVFSASLGFGVLICALFVLGLMRLYYAGVFALLLALPVFGAWKDARAMAASFFSLGRKWRVCEDLRNPLAGVSVAFGAIFGFMTLIMALTPSVVFDFLKFHLVAVRFFAAQHALRPVPLMDYSYFPQGAEVLMTVGYVLAGQAGAQMVSPLFFFLFVLLSVQTARVCGASSTAAVTGSVLAAAIPFVHWSGSAPKNDLVMSFFQLAALYSYLKWTQSREFRWIQLGTFFLATSFGLKHVAIFGAVGIALLYAYAVIRQRRPVQAALTLIPIFGIFGLFWHARTYLLTGNPVFPMSTKVSVTAAATQHGYGALRETVRYLRLPYDIQFHGFAAFESVSQNPVGFALVVFLPVWILGRRKDACTAGRACLAFAAIYLCYWATILTTLRYAILPFVILVVLSADRVDRFYRQSATLIRGTILASLVYCFVFAWCLIVIFEVNAPQLAYLVWRSDRGTFLRQALPAYAPLEYLQEHAGPTDLVFSVDNDWVGYAPDPTRFITDPCSVSACSSETILAELRLRPYQYLILPRASRYRAAEAGLAAQRVFEDPVYAVYRLAPAPERPARP